MSSVPARSKPQAAERRIDYWWKRPLDLVFCVLVAPLIVPVALMTWLLIRVCLGAPATFRQTRPGLHGKTFTLIKFRTMRDALDAKGEPLPDEERLTSLGRFLRSTSLDELPELWNILVGNMTLVGPRPLLVEYLPLYSEEHRRRHLVPPGLTGWAQINGRNDVLWPAKLDMDVWYVDHCSLWLDLRVLVVTPLRVLRREGISRTGHSTMEKFNGYDNS